MLPGWWPLPAPVVEEERGGATAPPSAWVVSASSPGQDGGPLARKSFRARVRWGGRLSPRRGAERPEQARAQGPRVLTPQNRRLRGLRGVQRCAPDRLGERAGAHREEGEGGEWAGWGHTGRGCSPQATCTMAVRSGEPGLACFLLPTASLGALGGWH